MRPPERERPDPQIAHPPTQYLADSGWGIHYAAAEDRQAGSSIDFERGRSGEDLARVFEAYFRPPSDSESEIEGDGSCFF